jgi:hypothetical protein
MEKQFKNLLWLYKEYIKIFNNWETYKKDNKDYANLEDLVCVFHKITDILVRNGIIECYGIKHYRVIETGEII